MITLSSLIKTAPFDEQTRSMLLAKIEANELSDAQKFELSTLCWEMIIPLYQTELELRIKDLITQQAQGDHPQTIRDFGELEAELIHRFASKLESAETEEEIQAVREQLTKPATQH